MTKNTPTIDLDGQTMTGDAWVTPDAYITEDIEEGRLPCLKGSTPAELPALGEPTGPVNVIGDTLARCERFT